MTRQFLQTRLAIILVLQLATGAGFAGAESPAIGTVVSAGAFRLNGATLTNNATLFEGATIETGAAASRLNLSSGTKVELGSESRGHFFGDHLVLERGQSRIDKADGFRVEALGLTILPDTGASTGRVLLAAKTRVEVATLTGSFRVLNSRGMMVARIPSGRALAFEPQMKVGPARLTGRLESRGGRYLLKDETTNVIVEVTAPELEKPVLAKEVGRRIEVIGTSDPAATPVSDATQVIVVAQVSPPPQSGTAPAGSGGGASGGSAGGGAAAGGAAGGSAGGAGAGAAVSVTLIAVIGGVVAAAVVGGLAASGSLGGGATPVSR